MERILAMRNPFFNPPPRPTLTTGQLTALIVQVRNFLNANAASDEITDAQLIALDPAFAATPGLLSAVKAIVALAQ
jgi:hypothetical protein